MARGPDRDQAARESHRDGAEGRARRHARATKRLRSESKVETATGFRRDASLSGVPSRAAVTAAFRTAKDGVGQTPGAGGSEWIVFRVTDVTDAASRYRLR